MTVTVTTPPVTVTVTAPQRAVTAEPQGAVTAASQPVTVTVTAPQRVVTAEPQGAVSVCCTSDWSSNCDRRCLIAAPQVAGVVQEQLSEAEEASYLPDAELMNVQFR